MAGICDCVLSGGDRAATAASGAAGFLPTAGECFEQAGESAGQSSQYSESFTALTEDFYLHVSQGESIDRPLSGPAARIIEGIMQTAALATQHRAA